MKDTLGKLTTVLAVGLSLTALVPVACSSGDNVPAVGKEQTKKNFEQEEADRAADAAKLKVKGKARGFAEGKSIKSRAIAE
jgi:hypothetical protein